MWLVADFLTSPLSHEKRAMSMIFVSQLLCGWRGDYTGLSPAPDIHRERN